MKARVEQVVEELSRLPGADLAGLEWEVRKRFLGLAGEALEMLCGGLGKGYVGTRRPCGCGERSRYEGDRTRRVVTVCGPVKVRRAYYRCRSCGRGEHPLDAELKLEGGWSPGVVELVSLTGMSWSYARAADIMQRTTGVRISATAVETLTERQGERAIEVMQRGGPVEIPAGGGRDGERTSVYVDGVMTPLRGRWAETKLGVVRTAQGCKRYVAHLGPPEPLGRMLRRAAARVGAGRSDEVTVVGDGAPWIWKQAAVNFPGAVEVVDWYHASEHIHDAALKLYGEASPQGHTWASRKRDVLWEQGARGLLQTLARGPLRQRRAVKELTRYLRTNLHRMDYPRFRQMQIDIASGPVESACKQVVQARLKQAGMRWTPQDAQKIIALRCIYLSDLWDSFWSRAA